MELSEGWVAPLIIGMLIAALLIALLQGAFQVEDNTLAVTVKLLVVILLAAGGGEAALHGAAALLHDWIAHIPQMIDRSWS